jgi:diguanylate cyclase (GGDEF)-like protein
MSGSLYKKFFIFAVPASILAVAYLALPRTGSLPPVWRELLPSLPYIAIAAGIFLSLHFHRSRSFFILLMLAVFYWCCSSFLKDGLADFRSRMVFQSLSILLPCNILLFCLMRERGVLSLGGRLRLIFLGIQAGVIVWIVQGNFTSVEHLLTEKFVSSLFLDRLALSQAAFFLLCIAALFMALRIFMRQSPVDSGILGVLAAVAFVCNRQGSPEVSLVFVTAAGLIMTLTVLQDTYNMAFRDDLTGLPSRRALNEQLTALGRKYVIAMVDIDHFKRFNDTHGHDVGDQVLKMVAGKIEGVKGGGKPFRYGGEEFTIIFPRKTMAETVAHLEELRKAIAGYKLWLRSADRPVKAKEGEKRRSGDGGETAVSVTVSIGLAESEEGHSPADILRAADKALYRAKHKGRNQVSK